MSMQSQSTIAVIGAGVIGSAIACALARAGHRVLLFDRDDPGVAGASFGNAGHIAAELREPLPSRQLLFGFWRELSTFDGPLDIPLRRLAAFTPWAARFAWAAFRRDTNTRALAPMVRDSVDSLQRMLLGIGRGDLLRRHGHYEVWMGKSAAQRAQAQADHMHGLEVRTEAAPAELLHRVQHAAGANSIAGLWFPECAHVVSPLEVVRAFAAAAATAGATVMRREVRALVPHEGGISVQTGDGAFRVRSAWVCAGAWSAELFKRLGVRVPLEAARGYHVEMPGHEPLVDAPVLYTDQSILVTPMTGRLRATSYMEFREHAAAADPSKPARLCALLRSLGYASDAAAGSWMGSRPVLPDYLPAIGQLKSAPGIFYAFGHQHIGLTLAAITAELAAELVAGRSPRHDLAPFALERFGMPWRRLERSMVNEA